MASVNKVILIGRLGKDPEVRYTPGGATVADFNIATDDSWTDKNGQKQEKTEWHKIVVWGRTAELCGEYLKKGRQVYIEGSLQTREYQDKDGNRRWSTEVKALTVQFLDSRPPGEGRMEGGAPPQGRSGGYGGGGGGGGGYDRGPSGPSEPRGPAPTGPGPQGGPSGPPGPDFRDDDIPF